MTECKTTVVQTRKPSKRNCFVGLYVAYCRCGWDTPIVSGEARAESLAVEHLTQKKAACSDARPSPELSAHLERA